MNTYYFCEAFLQCKIKQLAIVQLQIAMTNIRVNASGIFLLFTFLPIKIHESCLFVRSAVEHFTMLSVCK
jgi:hypothetical protein